MTDDTHERLGLRFSAGFTATPPQRLLSAKTLSIPTPVFTYERAAVNGGVDSRESAEGPSLSGKTTPEP
jgi:hypothetical protein